MMQHSQQLALVPAEPHICQLKADLSKGAEQVPFLLPAFHETADPAENEQPAVILFGLDHKNRAHASWFDVLSAYEARQAAPQMNMASLDIINNHLRSLVKELPKGKMFPSGKAFVPFIRRDLYDQLAVYTQAQDNTEKQEKPVQCGDEPSAKWYKGKPGSKYASDWKNLKKGDIALAVGDPEDGWWEVRILDVLENDTFRVEWKDSPELEPFQRNAKELAVFHPNYEPDHD